MPARGKPIPRRKVEEVEALKELVLKHKVIGLTDIAGIGSNQLQELRRLLRGKALIKVAKNTLTKSSVRGAEGAKKGISGIEKYLSGSNALIFTNLNPFELNLLLEDVKVPAPAKAGIIAQSDIIIPAGNTGLEASKSGLLLGALGKLRIPTKVEEGAIVILKDSVIVKGGEPIKPEVVEILNKLEVKPLTIGLSIKALYNDGLILTSKELSLNIDEYRENIAQAYMKALQLSLSLAYPLPENINLLIQKASIEAQSLAINAAIPTPETILKLILKAYNQALNLKKIVNSVVPNEC